VTVKAKNERQDAKTKVRPSNIRYQKKDGKAPDGGAHIDGIG
jgi:hypothetical protein